MSWLSRTDLIKLGFKPFSNEAFAGASRDAVAYEGDGDGEVMIIGDLCWREPSIQVIGTSLSAEDETEGDTIWFNIDLESVDHMNPSAFKDAMEALAKAPYRLLKQAMEKMDIEPMSTIPAERLSRLKVALTVPRNANRRVQDESLLGQIKSFLQ